MEALNQHRSAQRERARAHASAIVSGRRHRPRSQAVCHSQAASPTPHLPYRLHLRVLLTRAGTVLTSLRLLLAEPNADDPLMDEIAAQLRADPHGFRRAAVEHTRLHARPVSTAVGATGSALGANEAVRSGDAGPSSASLLPASTSTNLARPTESDINGSSEERDTKRPRLEAQAVDG